MFHKILCCQRRKERYPIKSYFFVSPISMIRALREKLNGLSLLVLIWSLKYRDILKPLEASLFFGEEENNLNCIISCILEITQEKAKQDNYCNFQRCFIVCRGPLPLGNLTFPRSWKRYGKGGLCHTNMLWTSPVGFTGSLMGEGNRMERG